MGAFDGKQFYSNKVAFKEKDSVYVISSIQSSIGTTPFIEGVFSITKVKTGSFSFSNGVYKYSFDLKALVQPKEPITIESIQAKLGRKTFASRYMNQAIPNLTTEEVNEFNSILSVENTEINSDDNISLNTDLDIIIQADTEKVAIILSRLGQGKFRQNVSKVWGIKQEVCLLSGLMLPDILTASHIVPWRECTDDKSSWRLDGANGILLSANYDRLFDRHLISFVRQGSSCVIQISERLSNSHRFQLGLTSDLYLSPNNMKNEDRERFFGYMTIHHEQFLKIEQKNILPLF
jgi:hypothetical protein